MRLKVYCAGKINDSAMWRKVKTDWPEVEFTARWYTIHIGDTPDEPCFAKTFWAHDHADVARADVLLLYADPADKMRGCLVEAGMALGLGKQVIVVGEHPDYGTWQYHAGVHKVKNLEQARTLLRAMSLTLD